MYRELKIIIIIFSNRSVPDEPLRSGESTFNTDAVYDYVDSQLVKQVSPSKQSEDINMEKCPAYGETATSLNITEESTSNTNPVYDCIDTQLVKQVSPSKQSEDINMEKSPAYGETATSPNVGVRRD